MGNLRAAEFERAAAAGAAKIARAAEEAETMSERLAVARRNINTMIEAARTMNNRMNAIADRITSEETKFLGTLARMTIESTPREDRNATDSAAPDQEPMADSLSVSTGYDGEPQPRYKDAIRWIRRLTADAEDLLEAKRPWAEPLRLRCRALLDRLLSHEASLTQALSELTPKPPVYLAVRLPNTEQTQEMISTMEEMEVLVRQLSEVQETADLVPERPSSSSSSRASSTMKLTAMSRWATKTTEMMVRSRATSLRASSSLEGLVSKMGRALSRSSKGKGRATGEGKETEDEE